jgi:prepilin-type N-terminal cleavage/methylation domain-containing protein
MQSWCRFTAEGAEGQRIAEVPERRGFTLAELVVVLVVLGILTGVVGMTLYRAPERVAVPEWQAVISAARDSALRYGESVTIVVRRDSLALPVTILPDGRVVADVELEFDILAGEKRDAKQ